MLAQHFPPRYTYHFFDGCLISNLHRHSQYSCVVDLQSMNRLEHHVEQATSLCTPRRPSEVGVAGSQAYQHIEPAELAPDEISQASSAGGLRDVQLVEHDVRQAEAAKPVDRLGSPRLVPRGQDNGEPAGRQLPAYLEPMPRFPPVTRATLTSTRK